MRVSKVVTGSVLTAGLGIAGLLGAGAASAAPGISYDNGTGGTNTVGIGDQSASGAYANASEGNRALSIALSNPTSAVVGGNADGNTAVAALGSTVLINGNASNNFVFANGGSDVHLNGNDSDNKIATFGSKVRTVSNPSGAVSVSVCGTSLTAQSAKIKISPTTCG